MSLEEKFANSNHNPLSEFHEKYKNEKFVHLQLFEKDLSYQIKRFPVNRAYPKKKSGSGTKQKITRLTPRSKQRMIHKIRNSNHEFKSFLTLTYPALFPTCGRVVKRHLNNFLTQLRKQYPNAQYFWCLEFQKRLAPHLHLILSIEIPAQNHFSETWSNVWTKIVCDDEPHRDSNFMDVYSWREFQKPCNGNRDKHLKHGCRVDPVIHNNPAKLANYFAKYFSKDSQKVVPSNFKNIGRLWGNSRMLSKPVSQGVYLLSEIKAALRTCYRHVNAQRRKYNLEHELQLRKIKENVGQGFCFWNLRGQFDSQIFKFYEALLENRIMGLHSPPALNEQEFCNLITIYESG
jgi:hypothetical protein